MNLTNENYFSKEMSMKYFSVSQYKALAGYMGRPSCEAKAIAELNGEWTREKTTALLVGSYVDAAFEGTLATFKAQNPDLFKKDGGLKAEYVRADEIINRIERDPLFMQYMSGEKQVIMTATMFGYEWKIKLDSYHPDKAIVDLKVMATINKLEWLKDVGKLNFVDYWGYDTQLAVYQEVVRLNTGKKLPCFIAVATKEPYPNIEILAVDQNKLDEALTEVESNIERVNMLKIGETKPVRCETCDYCKFTKVLTKPIHYLDVPESI